MRISKHDYVQGLLAITLIVAMIHVAFGIKVRLDPQPEPERVLSSRHPANEDVGEP